MYDEFSPSDGVLYDFQCTIQSVEDFKSPSEMSQTIGGWDYDKKKQHKGYFQELRSSIQEMRSSLGYGGSQSSRMSNLIKRAEAAVSKLDQVLKLF